MGYAIGYSILSYVIFSVAMAVALPEWFTKTLRGKGIFLSSRWDAVGFLILVGTGLFLFVLLIGLPAMLAFSAIAQSAGLVHAVFPVVAVLGTAGLAYWYRKEKEKEDGN